MLTDEDSGARGRRRRVVLLVAAVATFATGLGVGLVVGLNVAKRSESASAGAGVGAGVGAGAGCPSGLSSCDGAAPGCGIELQINVSHCGSCGTTCAAPPNALPSCNKGTCGYTCKNGWADCDLCGCNGCETNLAASSTSCGRCGATCAALPNASPSCNNGTCGYTCENGFGDCDGNASNGCETNLVASVTSCGRCGATCGAPPNASPSCNDGACGYTCKQGWADCDGNASNGCETNLVTSLANCGRCGAACGAPSNSVAACNSGTCGYTCDMGRADCDQNALNGCEANLGTDTTNCGSCGNICPSLVGNVLGIASCVTGVCKLELPPPSENQMPP